MSFRIRSDKGRFKIKVFPCFQENGKYCFHPNCIGRNGFENFKTFLPGDTITIPVVSELQDFWRKIRLFEETEEITTNG